MNTLCHSGKAALTAAFFISSVATKPVDVRQKGLIARSSLGEAIIAQSPKI